MGAVYFQSATPESLCRSMVLLKQPDIGRWLAARGSVNAGEYSWLRLAETTLTVYSQALGIKGH
jgi:hypothetical protein